MVIRTTNTAEAAPILTCARLVTTLVKLELRGGEMYCQYRLGALRGADSESSDVDGLQMSRFTIDKETANPRGR
jgi:hypothetical protein